VAGTPGYYDCGGEDGDPSGEFPLVCPPVDGPLPDISIDSAPGPDCPEIPDGGCCDGTLLIWCENGVDRTFDCTGLSEDPIFHDYLFCGTNPTSGMADCLKKPDPSPPECGGGSVEPEPPVEGIGEDLTTVDEDGPETMETMSEIGTDDKNSELSDDWTLEGGGITIPVEESTQPPGKKKNKGCSGAPVGSNACGWLTFLVLLLIIRLLGRRRPV
jgi:hypothetical protein